MQTVLLIISNNINRYKIYTKDSEMKKCISMNIVGLNSRLP